MANALCVKRLMADWKALQREPVVGAAAAPVGREDASDLTLWDGCIEVVMPTPADPQAKVPLYFLIEFPGEYPTKAPSIGFQYPVPYTMGATMTVGAGRLKGKMAICLDILGNFDFVHTEWKGQVGSGWSPAYSVQTLLLNLQSVLVDLGTTVSSADRTKLTRDATAFVSANPSHVLDIARTAAATDAVDPDILALSGGDADAAAKVAHEVFGGAAARDKPRLLDALSALLRAHNVDVPHLAAAPAVDPNIRCYNLGSGYADDVLGVLAKWEKNKIVSPCEMLCAEAWAAGVRQSTTKDAFTHYLPVWINPQHAAQKSWRPLLEKNVVALAQGSRDAAGMGSFAAAVLEVYPRVLNGLLVDLFDERVGKAAAIAYFEGFVNLWRTFRAILEDNTAVRKQLVGKVATFVRSEDARHKAATPDIGMVLAMYIAGYAFHGMPAEADFTSAYIDEALLRGVIWWRRDRVPLGDAKRVFAASSIGRCLLMFQLLVKDIVLASAEGVGEGASAGARVAAGVKAMDESNCTLPARLDVLLREWKRVREHVDGADGGWKAYFMQVGMQKPSFASMEMWLANIVSRADARGTQYSGKGGKGKGAKGGKGKGGKGAYAQ